MPRGNHSSGSRKSPAVIALLVIVLVAAGVGALFVLKAGKNAETEPGGGGDHRIGTSTPDFAFEVRKVEIVPSVAGMKVDKEAGQALAEQVADELSTFYKAAYLDPNNWSENKYDAAWTFFDESAAASVEKDADSLTLGDGSGFETVEPKPGTTSVKILVGDKSKPETAVAQVTFGVLATNASGQQTTVASLGQYFLRPTGARTWEIFAYKIQRSEQDGDQIVGSPPPSPKKTKPSPEASPS